MVLLLSPPVVLMAKDAARATKRVGSLTVEKVTETTLSELLGLPGMKVTHFAIERQGEIQYLHLFCEHERDVALLANVYLHEMDKVWWERYYGTLTQKQRQIRRRKGLGNVQLVRYADDFLILTNGTKEQARELMEEFRAILEELGLTLSPEKTRLTHVDDGYEFLGFHIQRKPRRCALQQKALYTSPTQRNIQRYKEKIKALLRPTQGDPVNKIRAVNRVVRGWANYYRHVQSARVRQKLDYWTFRAVWKWLYRKHGGNVGWKELYNRFITRNAKGRKVLGYKAVHLARMSDVHYRRYYSPKGGIQNPYLKRNQPSMTFIEDDPIADETWDGTSTQKGFALIRQDLLAQCGPICHRCKREFPPHQLHAHHVKALKHGGKDRQSNLELLCGRCHARTKNYGTGHWRILAALFGGHRFPQMNTDFCLALDG